MEGEPFIFYVHKAFTDLVFFMVISVVGLDIVFGIVVDTFAELRDSKVSSVRPNGEKIYKMATYMYVIL